jgi:glycerol-3-phosphate acyltransferase PlsY
LTFEPRARKATFLASALYHRGPMDPANAAAVSPSSLLWAALPCAAYVVGSFPTAHLLARSRGVDLGTVGSKNYGATNLGRTLGRSWGILCFVLDALKGAAPVLLAGWLLGALGAAPGSIGPATAWCWLATAAAAIVGHTLSPWIGFKGGKGVATGFGALAAMWPVLTLPAALALVLWCVLVLLFRMVSLASMVAAVAVPCAVAVASVASNGLTGARDAAPFLVVSTLIAIFVVWKHRANIARIRAGTESKVLQKKPNASTTSASSTSAEVKS